MELETDRLFVSPISNEHDEFMVRLLNDPGFIQFVGDRNVSTPEQAREYIEKPIMSFDESGMGLFCVKQKITNESIGICSLLKRDNLPFNDIGFAFLPDFRGQGLALEATRAVLDYAIKDLNLLRILSVTNADNVRSITLLKKLGFRFESMIQFTKEGPESNLFSIEFDSNYNRL